MIGRLRSSRAEGTDQGAVALRPPAEPAIDRARADFVAVAAPSVGALELEAVSEVLRSGLVSSAGPAVERFEARLAQRCGTEHAVALATGTRALELLMYALDVGEGDEIVVPALTFVSVGWAVAAAGATPVYVDVDPGSLNMDLRALEGAITERTRGIVAVHTFGHPCDVGAVKQIADRARLFVIEDACEALGATLRGAPVGGLGDAAVHSFYANKMMTTGNGGAVTTSHGELAASLRRLRGYSTEPGYHFWHPDPPFNARMTALQAALGDAQLQRLDELVAMRESLAARYSDALRGIDGVRLPAPCAIGRHTYWMYTIHVDEERYGADAASVRTRLAAHGLETRAVFTPLHAQPILARGPLPSFPVAEWAARTGINLPSGPHVRDEHVERVARVLRRELAP